MILSRRETSVSMTSIHRKAGLCMYARMAKPFMAPILVISILLLVVESATTAAFASPADVNIYNQVGGTIKVHCKSGDDDLGERTLLNGQQFGWGFMPNFWGTTLFHCSFRWGAKSQAFKVWTDMGWAGTKQRPCKHCEWHVTPEGFYRNNAGQPRVFVYVWQ